ncbi:hypothetical protein [Agaribacterium sp. ZY112]|uniref:hypothetical protein n=1 Tax=Agaribacterium sp. ZY112 TaxID=3233574 RepID=UPI003525E158
MKIKTAILTLLTALSFNSYACDMDKSSYKKHGKGYKEVQELVSSYMLEQGDITQTEIDQRKQEHELIRQEMRELKESGDTEAFKTRKKQLKEQHKAERERMKDYLNEHPDLKEQVKTMKKELRKQSKKDLD